MMYLSTLLINVGDNPDRPRPGRLWLRNLYRVHQRLCMAFPSSQRRQDDPMFLKPYAPGDFAPGHVHVPRQPTQGFLYYIDPRPAGRVVIIVLSAIRPDWDYAFHNARHLLAAPPSGPRPLKLDIRPGARFEFRLLANPTRRPPLTKEQWKKKKLAGEHVKRPRQQLTWSPGEDPKKVLGQWLQARAKRAGFKLVDDKLRISRVGYVYIRKGSPDDKSQRLRSVLYEGLLEVTDRDRFWRALQSGIGPAKAFGFGLLSIAPAPSHRLNDEYRRQAP
ncbi:type I-E CRISPR-associated protein Cas6/Cse3/CasE [Fontivita pretiosa]|uniref:type I-E CRISPR-associated protein Cas6/Cse3/CasE n=1 Tax=Fontivita pretiosa TaxID=2989684 RepID=UPI003D177A30